MGASGKMDAEIPPDAGEQCLRFKLRPAVRVLALYSVVGITAVANSSFMCTWNNPMEVGATLRLAVTAS